MERFAFVAMINLSPPKDHHLSPTFYFGGTWDGTPEHHTPTDKGMGLDPCQATTWQRMKPKIAAPEYAASFRGKGRGCED